MFPNIWYMLISFKLRQAFIIIYPQFLTPAAQTTDAYNHSYVYQGLFSCARALPR